MTYQHNKVHNDRARFIICVIFTIKKLLKCNLAFDITVFKNNYQIGVKIRLFSDECKEIIKY